MKVTWTRKVFYWTYAGIHLSGRTSLPSERSYALSRFPKRKPGVGRSRSLPPGPRKVESIDSVSPLALPAMLAGTNDGLRRLLFRENTLVIERQLEMMNVFLGFEQSNKYTISSEEGEPLGFIAEEPRGFLGTLSRQVLATHRPFRAVIMDKEGKPVLWVRRPFAWINSRMHVQRLKDHSEYVLDAEPALDTFGEVQQIWHPWRRRYDLFHREPFVSTSMAEMGAQPEQVEEATYFQVGKVDAGFLAWHFRILDGNGDEIACVDRAFRGIGRELFTDTGKYSVHFERRELVRETSLPNIPQDQKPSVCRELNIDERAIFLALAVNIDFDYFSRHSHTGPGGGLFHIPSWD